MYYKTFFKVRISTLSLPFQIKVTSHYLLSILLRLEARVSNIKEQGWRNLVAGYGSCHANI